MAESSRIENSAVACARTVKKQAYRGCAMKSRALLMIVMLGIAGCRAASADPVPEELDRLSALLAKIEADGVPDMLKETFAPNRAAIERVRKATSPQLRRRLAHALED